MYIYSVGVVVACREREREREKAREEMREERDRDQENVHYETSLKQGHTEHVATNISNIFFFQAIKGLFEPPFHPSLPPNIYCPTSPIHFLHNDGMSLTCSVQIPL